MRKFSWILMACATSVAFMGCGKSRAKPSDEEKAKLREVWTSVSRAQGAIPAKGSTTPSNALIHASLSSAMKGDPAEVIKALTLAGTSAKSDLDDRRVRMQNQLQESVEKGDCTVTNQGLDSATSGQVDPNSGASGSLSVGGEKCPVKFDLVVATTKDSAENSMGFTMSYSVVDEEYRKLNDVDSFTIDLKLGFKVSEDGSSASLSSSIDTKIHSAKYGNITEKGQGSGSFNRDGGKFNMTATDTFPTFSVERGMGFTVNSSGNPEYRYTVNGNDVSKEEFMSYGEVTTPTPSPEKQ